VPVSRFNDYIVPSPTKDVVVEDELWDLAATASDHADSDEVSLRGASKARTIYRCRFDVFLKKKVSEASLSSILQVDTDYDAPTAKDLTVRGQRVGLLSPPPPPPSRANSNASLTQAAHARPLLDGVAYFPPPLPPKLRATPASAVSRLSAAAPAFEPTTRRGAQPPPRQEVSPITYAPAAGHRKTLGDLGRHLLGIALTA